MSNLSGGEVVVKTGSFLYYGNHVVGVRIVRTSSPPFWYECEMKALAQDAADVRKYFIVDWGSATKQSEFASRDEGFTSLGDAVSYVEQTLAACGLTLLSLEDAGT